MQTRTFFAAAVAGTTIAIAGASAHAATFSISTTAPTTDGADIANLDQSTRFFDWGTSALWGDRPTRGQTFLVGGDDVFVNSVTVQAGGNQAGNGTWILRIGSISGTSFTEITSESVTTTQDVLDEDYFTITLDNAVQLDANTLYGFDIGRQGSGFGIYNNTTYADGTRYSSGSNAIGGATISTHTNDRVFHINAVAIPEPGSMALLALGGLMMARRRRG